MPIIGPGIPAPVTTNTNNHANLGDSGIQASNYTDPPPGKFTLGQMADKADWGSIFPERKILSPYLKEELYKDDFWSQLILNTTYILSSPLFLISFAGLTARSIAYTTNDRLDKTEDDIETASQASYIPGYFLAPFVLTLTAGLVGLYLTLRDKYRAYKKLEAILENYTKERNEYLQSHDKVVAFYLILENMAELSLLESTSSKVDRNNHHNPAYQKVCNIEENLKKAFNKANLKYNIYPGADSSTGSAKPTLHSANLLSVIAQLQNILLSESFNFIIDKLKAEFKEQVQQLHKEKFFGDVAFEAVLENFCNRIDDDEYTQKYLLNLLGDRTRRKVAIRSSTLIKRTNLYEESALFLVQTALNKLINDPKATKVMHPHHVRLYELTRAVIFIIMDQDPNIILVPKEISEQAKPSTSQPQEQVILYAVVPSYQRIMRSVEPSPITTTIKRLTSMQNSGFGAHDSEQPDREVLIPDTVITNQTVVPMYRCTNLQQVPQYTNPPHMQMTQRPMLPMFMRLTEQQAAQQTTPPQPGFVPIIHQSHITRYETYTPEPIAPQLPPPPGFV